MQIIDLGITNFSEAYEVQIETLRKVSQGVSENTLIITEHRPVITVGRRGSRKNVLKSKAFLSSCGIEVLDIDRGGDVTYHAPGQLIAYPIFRLGSQGRDIHNFLDFLEEIGIHFLGQYGVMAVKRPGFRGAWVNENKKICSIGIGVKKWITYHGMAININIDLTPFSYIRPCGIEGVEIASLKAILGCDIDINEAKRKLALSFKEIPLLAEAVSKA